MRTDSQVRVRREPLAAKVPDITASFWVLKLTTTAMGEAASDYLLNTMGFVRVTREGERRESGFPPTGKKS